jgi:hypothetical protein
VGYDSLIPGARAAARKGVVSAVPRSALTARERVVTGPSAFDGAAAGAVEVRAQGRTWVISVAQDDREPIEPEFTHLVAENVLASPGLDGLIEDGFKPVSDFGEKGSVDTVLQDVCGVDAGDCRSEIAIEASG